MLFEKIFKSDGGGTKIRENKHKKIVTIKAGKILLFARLS